MPIVRATAAEIEQFIAQHDTRPAKTAWKPDTVEALEEQHVVVTIPIKTKNPTNNRQHWRTVSKRIKAEHKAVWLSLITVPNATRIALAAGCTVKMTRVSSGHLDPIDGLGPALKGVKDAVSAWLLGGTPGSMDEDERITWELGQLRAERGCAGVILSIRMRA